MPFGVVLADRSLDARRHLRRLLEPYSRFSVIAECASAESTLAVIRSVDPAIVFLDVSIGLPVPLDGQPADGDGPRGHRPGPAWIATFVAELAPLARDLPVAARLAKPVAARELRSAIESARAAWRAGRPRRRRFATTISELVAARDAGAQRLLVREAGRYVLVRADELDWVEAAGNYVRLHVGAQVYRLRESLAALEGRLDPHRFVRIHRSAIVSLDRVRELRCLVSGDHRLTLRDGTELTLSRTFRAQFERQALSAPAGAQAS